MNTSSEKKTPIKPKTSFMNIDSALLVFKAVDVRADIILIRT